MLTRFASDLAKLAQPEGGATPDSMLSDALIALAMEKYYRETNAGDKNELFTATNGGVQFNTGDIAPSILDAKGYSQYLSNYLVSGEHFSIDELVTIKSKLTTLNDWSIALTAAGMTASDDGNKGALMLGNAGNDVLTGGSGDDLLAGAEGNDTLVGGSGDDTLIGGAGADVYYADEGDTIKDADGIGAVYLNGKKLGFAVRHKGESEWTDGDGNHYGLSNGTLRINDPLVIENFANGNLGIYLDDEEDPSDPKGLPQPPAYNPGSAIRRCDPLVLDLDGNGAIDAIASGASSAYFDLNGDGIAERGGWRRRNLRRGRR